MTNPVASLAALRYQVWRCLHCGAVRFQPPEYPIATAASAEIHACSPMEGSYMVMIGYVELGARGRPEGPSAPPTDEEIVALICRLFAYSTNYAMSASDVILAKCNAVRDFPFTN